MKSAAKPKGEMNHCLQNRSSSDIATQTYYIELADVTPFQAILP